MIESLTSVINELSMGNQGIAGGITLALTGSALYVIKETPRTVYNFIKKQCTTSLTLNNSDWQKNQTFIQLNKFIKSKTTETGSRTVSIDSYWDEDECCAKVVLSLGYGLHFFWYKGRLMWVEKRMLESSGSERQKEQTTITYLGRSHRVFEEILEDNKRDKDNNKFTVSEFKNNEWRPISEHDKRGLDLLALNPEIKNFFKCEIEYFKNNKDTYVKLGLPYKTTMLLHGKPGTGKTSIIRAIASDFDLNVCTININNHSDQSFSDALSTAPKNSIILIEDFDSSSSVKDRAVTKKDGDSLDDIRASFLTLTGILNSLDGVCSLDGNIVFMTTNHLEQIDPAVYRSGRVDHVVELPKIDQKTVKDYFCRLYDGIEESVTEFKEMKACEINSVVFKSKESKEVAARELNKLIEGS